VPTGGVPAGVPGALPQPLHLVLELLELRGPPRGGRHAAALLHQVAREDAADARGGPRDRAGTRPRSDAARGRRPPASGELIPRFPGALRSASGPRAPC